MQKDTDIDRNKISKRLGISESYLSRIVNGYARPSYRMAERWKPITRWSYNRWISASTQAVQKMLARLGAA